MKRTLILALCAVGCNEALAVVGTTQTTVPPLDTVWTWVGQVNGASAVAIGPYTVLTAAHVGAGNFTLGATTYTDSTSFKAPGGIDLELINLNQKLPGWYNLGTSYSIGDTITMVGYGTTGYVDPAGTGYQTSAPRGRHAANNTIDFTQTIPGYGPLMFSYLKVAGNAALTGGDSGGGWFNSSGQLVGINDVTFNNSYEDNPPNPNSPPPPAFADYGFGSADTGWTDPTDPSNVLSPGEPYFGSGAVDLTNSTVENFIHTNAVPEPSEVFGLVFGLSGLILATRRSRK